MGNWLDVVPATTYQNDPHQSILGVGERETTTLLLQNPRGDGVPATGYWSLNFDRNLIHVYTSDGQEVVPDSGGGFSTTGENPGSRVIVTVPGYSSKAVTLTVVGIGGGVADLDATWHVWGWTGGPQAGWTWDTTETAEFTVLALMWDGQDVTNKHHVPAKAGQRIDLSVAAVPNPDTAAYWWAIDGPYEGYVKDFDPTKETDQVSYLIGDDFHHPTLRFVWVAGGTEREVDVTVDGLTLSTWFDVARPEGVVTTLENNNTIEGGMNGINPFSDGTGVEVAFGYHDAQRTVEGITFQATPASVSGYQTCFCQVIESAQWTVKDDSEKIIVPPNISDALDGDFPYPRESADGLLAWDSPGHNPELVSHYVDGGELSEVASFSMWLMGRPTGVADAIWIPLVRVNWNFHWTLGYDNQDFHCVITGAGHSVTGNHDTIVFPAWNNTVGAV